MSTIKSLQIGRILTEGDPDARGILERQWTTGFYKMPATGAVELQPEGLVGDAVADTQHHGGVDKAVLCYADAHYASWRAEHPELEIGPGGLGENLTIEDGDETSTCVGDRYHVGSCEVQVSQPRQPCWKISRRWGIKTMTKEVTETGRTGWYLRVITPGSIRAGDCLELIERPHADWPIARANDVLFGREVGRLAVIELMNLPELADAWKESIS